MVLLAIRSKSVYKYICYKIYKIIDEVTLMSKLAKREESEKKKGTCTIRLLLNVLLYKYNY